MPSILIPEQYRWTRDKPNFNIFVDVPINFRPGKIVEEFVLACKLYPAWGATQIFGNGDFELLPFQGAMIKMLWSVPFPLLIASRGASKSFILSIYCLMRAVLTQNSRLGEKIVIVGSAFRQSKLVFDEIVRWIDLSPLIQECQPKISLSADRCQIKLGNSTITALPLGTGEKIRGYRATIVVADEYAQIPEEIFQVVVRGFGAVSQDPVKRVREMAEIKKLKAAGLLAQDSPDTFAQSNQTIMSSTAFYKFNHLYKTYDKYKTIIQNKMLGNTRDYTHILGEDVREGQIDYRKFAVCRLPYTELPEGFLEPDQLAEARVTMSDARFRMEYGAEFIEDTEGFFKRTHIEDCTPRPMIKDGKEIDGDSFVVELESDRKSIYVMGIDPARSRDNFAIAIIKIHRDKMKLVYVTTFNKRDHLKIASTVHDLIERFDIQAIGIDKGGGGQTFADIMANPDIAKEFPRIFDKDDEQYENVRGEHIIELINYQGEWLRNANYDLQADLDTKHKRFLFPYTHNETDYADETVAYAGSKIDEIGKAWIEILEAKEEICSIIMTNTGKSEIPHFDLPDIGKTPFDTRRKDRYSAVLIAADQARRILIGDTLKEDPNIKKRAFMGGWIEDL